ncbi:MAG: hypothetical protein M3P51_03330 [Chloroflexota bacterium]|nr:hypothetical protein [Chloroflexota bacterium]
MSSWRDRTAWLNRIDLADLLGDALNTANRVRQGGHEAEAVRRLDWWEEALAIDTEAVARRLGVLHGRSDFGTATQRFRRENAWRRGAITGLGAAVNEGVRARFVRWRPVGRAYGEAIRRMVAEQQALLRIAEAQPAVSAAGTSAALRLNPVFDARFSAWRNELAREDAPIRVRQHALYRVQTVVEEVHRAEEEHRRLVAERDLLQEQAAAFAELFAGEPMPNHLVQQIDMLRRRIEVGSIRARWSDGLQVAGDVSRRLDAVIDARRSPDAPVLDRRSVPSRAYVAVQPEPALGKPALPPAPTSLVDERQHLAASLSGALRDVLASRRAHQEVFSAAVRRQYTTLRDAGQALSVDHARTLLYELRDSQLSQLRPPPLPGAGLLREAMVDALLRHRPITRDEWQDRIPLDLRLDTDTRQMRYLDQVLAIIASIR